MNRRHFLTSLPVAGAGAFLFYIQPTEKQVTDLQEDVEALDQRVSALETRVADQSTGNLEEGNSASVGTPASSDAITLNGAGTSVSDKFSLASGQYRVNATLDVAGDFETFFVRVYDPSGDDELIFEQFIEQPGAWEGSAVYQAAIDGEYFVEVENTISPWTLSFEPF